VRKALRPAAFLAILLAIARAARGTADVAMQHVTVGGIDRTYQVEVPSDVVAKPALLVMLHGHGGSGAQMRRYKDIGTVTGDAAVIFYPNGIDRGWSDGRTQRQGADDIAFVRALIATAQARYHTDPDRVYVAGMSNGAMMALRIACQMPEVAAVAAVSGGLPVQWTNACDPGHPISVLGIDGTADPIVPYDGGGVYNDRNGDVLSAEATMATYRKLDRCGAARALPSTPVAADGTSTSFQVWSGCARGTSVELATVAGGGHGWPGAKQYLPKRLVGVVSRSFDADTAIWNFLRTKSL